MNDSLASKLATVRELTIHRDSRGSVRETFRASWFPAIPPIKQLVRSESDPLTLRGMHLHRTQYDVWHFVSGYALVRTFWPDGRGGGSDDYYRWCVGGETIAIPPGLAHGFYAPEGCTLMYALTEEFDGSDEFGFHWSDGIDLNAEYADEWPTDPSGLLISARDLSAPRLAEFVR